MGNWRSELLLGFLARILLIILFFPDQNHTREGLADDSL